MNMDNDVFKLDALTLISQRLLRYYPLSQRNLDDRFKKYPGSSPPRQNLSASTVPSV